MTTVAIVGGGIAGLSAAYELEQQRKAGKPIDWQLFESSDRFGGIVQTTRYATADGDYILESGPDAWVTEKPWARELAEELGLGNDIMPSNEADKKTYIWLDGKLVALPDRMRMMVPEDLETLDTSLLFSPVAKQAYAEELASAEQLKSAVPASDESVASFVQRHFGQEVLSKIGAPLLSGIFGGDTARLSVRAVMAPFVKMEAEHGSLIAALRAKRRERGDKPPQATFTTLRRGMGSLVDALVAVLPPKRLHRLTSVEALERTSDARWLVRTRKNTPNSYASESTHYRHVLLAVPVDAARDLLSPIDAEAAALIPQQASSAVLAVFCWPPETARSFTVPPGFGFLVPQQEASAVNSPKLLAGTLIDQKFAHRAPQGARVIRVFFGGAAAHELQGQSDERIATEALRELQYVLPCIPTPDSACTTVARWPRSLPQYEVGHIERMLELDKHIAAMGNLSLLGNGYRGVGVPDLIRDARQAARRIAATLDA